MDVIDMKIKPIEKIYYTESQNNCTLTDYSCKKLRVPRYSWFSMLDEHKIVYAPSKSGGSNNTHKNVYRYELIQKDDTDAPTCIHNIKGFCKECRKEALSDN